ncbi:hypothetical protein YC2023_079511 [Brassica napus]
MTESWQRFSLSGLSDRKDQWRNQVEILFDGVTVAVGKRHPEAVAEFAMVAAMHHLDVGDEKLTPVVHLASAHEGGALLSITHILKTSHDAFRTIMKEEEPIAFYKGIVPGLALFPQQVLHGAIQFTAYEELHKVIVDAIGKIRKYESADNLLVKSSSSP